MQDLTRNALVLKFFTQHGRCVGRTKLIKLSYLADLHARELLGRPITDFRYKWWDHGPFDDQFYSAASELVDAGLATEDVVQYPTGQVGKPLRDTGEPAVFEWSQAEAHILAYVVTQYMHTSLSSLLEDVVYQTEPMTYVRDHGHLGDPVPMERVNDKLKRHLGFDLEETLRAERDASAGRFKLAADFFDELRAKIVAQGSG